MFEQVKDYKSACAVLGKKPIDKRRKLDEHVILYIMLSTILNIVHQLKADSLKQYDEILVFSKGAIIERGNYDELIQKDGIFRSLLSVMSA